MLKLGLGCCQRPPVSGRGSPKATAIAGSASPLLPLLPPSFASASNPSPLKWAGILGLNHISPSSVALGRTLLPPSTAAATTTTTATATTHKSTSVNATGRHHQHHANGHGNGNGKGSGGGGAATDLQDAVVFRDAATAVRVHLVVPRCTTVPGEYLMLVGESDALGSWDVRKGVRLHWCSGHMHTATIALPAYAHSLKAKLVMVQGSGSNTSVSWEPGNDRSIVLQTSGGDDSGTTISTGSSKGGKDGKGAGVPVRGSAAHEYVVICHWGHTDATSVLTREVPGDVLMLEKQLSNALSELRTARNAASTSQEKLQRMAQDLADSERAARQSAEQLAELQTKHSAMATELTETKQALKGAKAAAAEAVAAAKANTVNVAEVEARVSQRYEGRMAELKQQLDGVKGQYSSELLALQRKLEASLSKEAEAQEMVKNLREIVQKDVARLRTELAQLVNEYIAARQQLQEQAQQIEASEKLRMQQIDGLSSEIKNLITKYNSAQQTIAEQQRLLDELQGSRDELLPSRTTDPVQNMTVPPSPDSQAGRGWRADWARLSKLSTNGSSAAAAGNSR